MRTPSRPRPANQGGASSAYVQTPTVGGRPADRGPAPSHNLNTSITKPGKSTRGDGTTKRSVKRG